MYPEDPIPFHDRNTWRALHSRPAASRPPGYVTDGYDRSSPPPEVPPGPTKPRRGVHRMRRLSRWRRWLALLLVGAVAGVALLAFGAYVLTLVPELPQLRAGQQPHLDLTTFIYADDGQEMGRLYRENRTWVALDDVSPHVVNALVATEDHRFYDHWGIDVRRMFGALFQTAGGNREGGSTLTMQLARNLYPEIGNDITLDRKLKEMMTAFKIERTYEKREILEMYLNTVPFGYNTFGIETASHLYFQKSAADLDVAEAAVLVGMLKGTSRYNPVRHPELARERRNVVYGQMERNGHLSPYQAMRLREEPLYLDFRPEPLSVSPAPYFLAYLRQWLEDWGSRNGYDPYADGLRVYTTLDLALQTAAQTAVAEELDALQAVVDYEWSTPHPRVLDREAGTYRYRRDAGHFTPFAHYWRAYPQYLDGFISQTPRFRHAVQRGAAPEVALARLKGDPAFLDSVRTARTRLEAGFVALDPYTGHVRAWVGGRNFGADQYDKVALAKRQPGSTFKPFVYAAAIDHGWSPYDVLPDSAMRFRVPGTDRYWQPYNAGGGYSGRLVTLREALVQSKNTVTAQLMHRLGAFEVGTYAKRMGITSALDFVPSLGLGTSEVTLLEMVAAYATFADGGQHHPPVVVTRIEDRNGQTVARFVPDPIDALSSRTAYTVLDMMRGVTNAGGTGGRVRSRYGVAGDLAGKTGTTQNSADGWFILLQPNLVAGAWVGFNDHRLTFRTDYWGQGGHNALNVVGRFFQEARAAGVLPTARDRFAPPPNYSTPRRATPGAPAADTPALRYADVPPVSPAWSLQAPADTTVQRTPKRLPRTAAPPRSDPDKGRIAW